MVVLESLQSSTSRFSRVQPGVILKYPVEVWKESRAFQRLTDEIANSFSVERQIFNKLGVHPRIVRYISRSLRQNTIHFGDVDLDTLDGKTPHEGCSLLRPATAASNNISTSTTILSPISSERNGVDKLSNRSCIFTTRV